MDRNMGNAAAVLTVMVLVTAAGVGIGWGFGTTMPSPPASGSTTTVTSTVQSSAAQDNGTYKLTLVEMMMVPWNSTTMQPKFYVLGSNGLESSANISLPAHRLIRLTIISYDTPTPNSSAMYAKVQGTVGGTMAFYNGTVATGFANETMDETMALGMNVTSVPASSLAHTFTIPQLGVNVPVVGGSMEVAYLYFNQTGSFSWFCMTPCGLGPGSALGAMVTPGWMTGNVVVS